jgi:hypothetical protein
MTLTIMWMLLVFAILISYGSENPDLAHARARVGSLLVSIPGDIWLGFGLVLLGMLWGEAVRAEAPPQREAALAAIVVSVAIMLDVSRKARRAARTPEFHMLVSPLQWLTLGLAPLAFLTGEFAPLGLAGRRVALLMAVMLILFGWVRWREGKLALASDARSKEGDPTA